jgi:hypothetical protein
MEESLSESNVVSRLSALLCKGESLSIPSFVIKIYKSDPRMKDFFRDELQTSVLDLLRRYPRLFKLDLKINCVSLADEIPLHTSEELSRHCTSEDAWIAVDGQVYDITEFVRTHWGWTSSGKYFFQILFLTY